MANEFVIKHGFISKGDSIVNGTISGETLNLTTIPSNDNSLTQVLVRNDTTGVVEYRDASTLSGSSATNTFVTGTTFSGNEAVLTRNDGFDVFKLSGSSSVTLSNPSTNKIFIDVVIPPGMNTYVTGGTYNPTTNIITLGRNDGVDLSISGLTDGFVTGATLNGDTLELGRNEGLSTLTVDLSSIDTDIFVTGGTYNASTVTLDFSGNTGFSPFSVDVSALKDDTNTYVTGNTYTSATDFTNQSILNLLYQGTTVGGPYSLSSEDTFVTGTTFSGNEAVLTRNDGVDVLKLTGGTNVTLSNPSSNQIKIDVSASSSIDTGNVLWVDDVFGNDGTALVDRQDRPWASIATAISNATTNDTILVRPGDYVEPAFTLNPSTSLVSQGGAKVTIISGSPSTGNFITISGSSYMEGFTVYTPTDDSAALYFNDSTAGITTTLNDIHFKGSSSTPGPLGKGIVMDTSLATNGKIIFRELRYGGGNLNVLAEVNKGIFALDGMHVPGGGTINTAIQVNGGRAQLINVNNGNSLCGVALSVSGTSLNKPTVAGFGFNIFNVPTGIEITSNDYDVEVQSGRLDAGTTNILITSGLTGSNGKLNLTGFVMDSTKLSVPNTWVDSNHIFTYSDLGESQNLSPIYRSWSNFEVGHANKGFDTNLGRGSEYQNGMHIITSGGGGTVVVTTTAKTEGDLFSFQSLTVGEQIYLGSSQKYVGGSYLNFNAFDITYTGSTGGTYTIEFYSGGTWVDIKYQCVHHELGYNYSNTMFSRSSASNEVIRFGIDDDVIWDSTTIDGQEGKWIRITMETTPASLPQFDLVWLDPSHTEVNTNGILNFYGNSLYRDTLISTGNIFGESGSVVTGSIPVGSGGLPTGWTHIIKNSELNSTSDAIMLQSTIPLGTCSAYPIRVKVHHSIQPGTTDGSGTPISPIMIISTLPRGAAGILVADPSGGVVTTPRTIANTSTFTSDAGTSETITLMYPGETPPFSDNLYANKPLIISTDFYIDDYYEGDDFFIRIELDNDGNDPNQDVVVFAVEIDIVKWALGERVRIE